MLVATVAYGAMNPYPVYGKTNPSITVKIVTDDKIYQTKSNTKGYYQIELNSDYDKAMIVVKSCSEAFALPPGPGLRKDFRCDKTGSLTLAAIVALAGAAGIAYTIKKRS